MLPLLLYYGWSPSTGSWPHVIRKLRRLFCADIISRMYKVVLLHGYQLPIYWTISESFLCLLFFSSQSYMCFVNLKNNNKISEKFFFKSQWKGWQHSSRHQDMWDTRKKTDYRLKNLCSVPVYLLGKLHLLADWTSDSSC